MRSKLVMLCVALAGGCAVEPRLSQMEYRCDGVTVEQVDDAFARAAGALGYIAVRSVAAGGYRARAVAEGDERYVDAAPRERAQVVWAHTLGAPDGSVRLILDVVARSERTSELVHELVSLMRTGGLTGIDEEGGTMTGLGYDPTRAPPALEVTRRE